MIAETWVDGHFPEASDSEKAHLMYAYAAGRDFGLWQAEMIMSGTRLDMSEREAAAAEREETAATKGTVESVFVMPMTPGIIKLPPEGTAAGGKQ